jgi:hypothetical protein
MLRKGGQTLDDAHQVRAAIRAGERVDFVYDHEAQVLEEARSGHAG